MYVQRWDIRTGEFVRELFEGRISWVTLSFQRERAEDGQIIFR
jgi:hypothetical protein